MPNTTIAIKKSGTPSAIPAALANGELAINYADGILYYKNTSGYIASISGGGGPGGNYYSIVDANGTLLIADTTGDVVSIYPGDNIIITGDALNDKMYINADLTAANSWANTKVASVTSNSNSRIWANTVTLGDGSKTVYMDLANSGVTATTYGSSSVIPVITVDSYGRITAASNVSATGGGGGSSVTFAEVTGTTQSAQKDYRYALTNNSVTTVTLPATPTAGDTLYIVICNGLANNVIARNGSNIMGLAEDMTIDISNFAFGLTYINASKGWWMI